MCGTGEHLRSLAAAGSHAIGLDVSFGMLRVARAKLPAAPLAQADLERPLPLRERAFDAVLCTLVGEHLTRPAAFFRNASKLLHAAGRLVFTIFHPEMAAGGMEANFEVLGAEVRLGAERHTVADYVASAEDAGFIVDVSEHCGDKALAREVPKAARYVGKPLLLVLSACRRL